MLIRDKILSLFKMVNRPLTMKELRKYERILGLDNRYVDYESFRVNTSLHLNRLKKLGYIDKNGSQFHNPIFSITKKGLDYLSNLKNEVISESIVREELERIIGDV